MRPHDNPYTPNAGARPPALVGRDAQLEAFEVLLDRLRRGHTEQSLLITGLRGVGKTVLLGAFEERAREREWTTVEAEITKNVEFGVRMAQLARRALLQVAPRARWRDRGRRAAEVLRSFQLTVSSSGRVDLRPGRRCRRRSGGQWQPWGGPDRCSRGVGGGRAGAGSRRRVPVRRGSVLELGGARSAHRCPAQDGSAPVCRSRSWARACRSFRGSPARPSPTQSVCSSSR